MQTVRKFGAITFVDLRDRYGITQLLFGEELNAALDAQPLGREFVLQAIGTVAERSNKNPNIPTGDIEIHISSFTILNKSAVPPFTIQDDTDGGDDLRMKYRFLDLRRNAIKKNLELRYAVNRSARNYLHENNFMDIETPFLIKSTPEGARDFVVPSRMNPGQFYALSGTCGLCDGFQFMFTVKLINAAFIRTICITLNVNKSLHANLRAFNPLG